MHKKKLIFLSLFAMMLFFDINHFKIIKILQYAAGAEIFLLLVPIITIFLLIIEKIQNKQKENPLILCISKDMVSIRELNRDSQAVTICAEFSRKNRLVGCESLLRLAILAARAQLSWEIGSRFSTFLIMKADLKELTSVEISAMKNAGKNLTTRVFLMDDNESIDDVNKRINLVGIFS
jgi:hypothetical protein